MNFFRALRVGYKLSTLGEAAKALLPVLVVYVTEFFMGEYIRTILIESNRTQLSLTYWWLQVAFVVSLIAAVLSFWKKGRDVDLSKGNR